MTDDERRYRAALEREQRRTASRLAQGVDRDVWSPTRVNPHDLQSSGRELTHVEQETVHSYRREGHLVYAVQHKELIASRMRDTLHSMVPSQAVVFTLHLGRGDLSHDVPRDELSEIEDQLDGMHRVQEVNVDTGETLVEIVPVRIYCFRERGRFEFQIGRLSINRVKSKDLVLRPPSDALVFDPIIEEKIRKDSSGKIQNTFVSLFDRLDAIAAQISPPFGVHYPRKYHWKGLFTDPYVPTSRTPKGMEVENPLLRKAAEEIESMQSGGTAAIYDLKKEKGEGGSNERRLPHIIPVRTTIVP